MSSDFVIGMAVETIKVTLLISAPMLLMGLIIGLAISIFQAVTQIQEMTLVFVPKIVAVLIALIISLPWMLNIMITYTQNILSNFPMYIR
ncbi:MAG: flagellar biosynthesis protein FliQ [Syntrophales bacterium]|jgi:flagellar biosynthesis protein FliQ